MKSATQKNRVSLNKERIPLIIHLVIAVVFASVVFPAHVYAQAPSDVPSNAKVTNKAAKKRKVKAQTPPKEEPNFAEKMVIRADKAADSLARKIDNTAQSVDVTLAGKKYTKKRNNSSISIKQLNVWSEGGKMQNSTSFGINLRLPNLEKRWQVRFASYDEQEEARDQQERRFRTRPRENKPGAALLFFKKLGKIRTTFQPRLELKDPLAMSYVLRFESEAELKPFHMTPRLDLFADPVKGTGEYFRLNFGVRLAPKWELTFLNDEEYRERTNFLNVNHGIALDYALADNKGLGLSFMTNSINLGGPYHLNQYAISPAYAQEIAEDRLRFVFATFLSFTKAEAFKGDAGCSLQIEVIF